MDNNILAAGDYCQAQFDKIIERGYRVDFNQALDARLITDEHAKRLAKMKWIDSRIRFGCDTPKQIDECERAMKMIDGYGFRGQYFLYCMLNDNFQECYNRVEYWWEINQRFVEAHKTKRVYPYSQPYRDPDNPNRPIPQWQKDMANWVNKKMVFEKTDFLNFMPRKGFRCEEYFLHPELLKLTGRYGRNRI